MKRYASRNVTVYGPAVGLVWPSGSLSQTVHSELKPPSLLMAMNSMARPAKSWMMNCPSSVSASAHSPPTVQYTAVMAPVMKMPWVRVMPVKTESRVAMAAHLAPTSTIFSSSPDQARACWVGML